MQSVQDIRDKAREHGIRMNSVCREAGIQQPQVSRWMSGSVKPLWESVNQLEQALDRLLLASEDSAPAKAKQTV